TPSPNSTTRPAISCPKVMGGVAGNEPSRMCRSEWQSPAASTAITTSPGPGRGAGTSSIFAGCRTPTKRTAFMWSNSPSVCDSDLPEPLSPASLGSDVQGQAPLPARNADQHFLAFRPLRGRQNRIAMDDRPCQDIHFARPATAGAAAVRDLDAG